MTIHVYVHDFYFGLRAWGNYLDFQHIDDVEGHGGESLVWDGNTFNCKGVEVSKPCVIFFHHLGFEEGRAEADAEALKKAWLFSNNSYGISVSGSRRAAADLADSGRHYYRAKEVPRNNMVNENFKACVVRFFEAFSKTSPPRWELLEPGTPSDLWISGKIVALLGLQGDVVDNVTNQVRIGWRLYGWGDPPGCFGLADLVNKYSKRIDECLALTPVLSAEISQLRHSWLDYLISKGEDFLAMVNNDQKELADFLGKQDGYVSRSQGLISRLNVDELLDQLSSSMTKAGCFERSTIDGILMHAREPATKIYTEFGSQFQPRLNAFITAFQTWKASPATLDAFNQMKQRAGELRSTLGLFPG